MKEITVSNIQSFKTRLQAEEKSSLTVEKYLRDIAVFSEWLGNKALSKENVLKFKEFLIETAFLFAADGMI